MKPPFKMRTFHFPEPESELDKASLEKAQQAWRAFYVSHPDRAEKRQILELLTIENMVQQYEKEHGFRPEGYETKYVAPTGWKK